MMEVSRATTYYRIRVCQQTSIRRKALRPGARIAIWLDDIRWTEDSAVWL